MTDNSITTLHSWVNQAGNLRGGGGQWGHGSRPSTRSCTGHLHLGKIIFSATPSPAQLKMFCRKSLNFFFLLVPFPQLNKQILLLKLGSSDEAQRAFHQN